MDGGFLVSDAVPSEASYSRLVTKLMACDLLETEKENMVHQLSQKVLFRMILLLPMPVMLKPVIKHHQKKTNQRPNLKTWP